MELFELSQSGSSKFRDMLNKLVKFALISMVLLALVTPSINVIARDSRTDFKSISSSQYRDIDGVDIIKSPREVLLIVPSEIKSENDREALFKAHINTDPVILSHLYYYITSGTPSIPSGDVRLYGYVRVRDPYARTSTTAYKIVTSILVDVWDQDSGEPYSDGYTPSGEFLTSTRTDSQGAFCMVYSAWDWSEFSNRDPVLQFYADVSNVVAIYAPDNRIYLYRMYNDYSNLGGGAYSLYIQGSTWTDPVSGQQLRRNDAMTVSYVTPSQSVVYVLGGPVGELILFTMLARSFAGSVLSEYNLPRLNVSYPALTDVYFYNSTDRRLWAPAALNYTEFFMAYAQFLLAQRYGYLPSFERNYNFGVRTNQQTAWVVGWSIFLSEVIKSYYSSSESFQIRNLESLYDYDSSRNDYDIASSVAAVLWDLYDSSNDDQDGDGIGDSLCISISDIWYVVRTYRPTTIFGFIDGLLSYRTDLSRTKVWELCWEHGINVDFKPPTRPEIINISPQPSITTWYNTSEVYLAWSQSTDAMSGVKGYLVRVYNYTSNSLYSWYGPYTQLYTTIRLPSGRWSISVVAIDRAGNGNESALKGPIQIDTIVPRIVSYSPSIGARFIDSETANIILGVSCEDQISGIYAVYIRYSYGGTSWSNWIAASYSVGMYRITIYASEWKPNVGKKLYWQAKCVDRAGNVVISQTFYVELVDDDPDPPEITFPTSPIVVYDSSGGNIVIWAIITDGSGIRSVTFIVYFHKYGVSIIYSGSSIYWDGNKAYVVIPRSVWINYVGSVFSLEVIAYDNDNDWQGDSARANPPPVVYGEILDDDPNGPLIHNVVVSEYLSSGAGDGIIEADEGLTIKICVSDISGVSSAILITMYNTTFTKIAQVLYTNGTYFELLLIINYQLRIGYLDLVITVYDLDNDGWAGDTSHFEYVLRLYVKAEEAIFSLPSEIEVLANSSVSIAFSIHLNDGGLVPIVGQKVYVKIYSPNELIGIVETYYTGENSQVIIDLASLQFVLGYLRLEFYIDESIFESKSNVVWMRVWALTSIEVSLSTNVAYSQEVVIYIILKDMFGNPVSSEYVYLLCGERVLSGGYTNRSGVALVRWVVDLPEGLHQIRVVFDGDGPRGYRPSATSAMIYVRKAQLVIQSSTSMFVFSDGGMIYATILTEFGVSINGVYAEVHVIVNDTMYLLGGNTSMHGRFILRISSNNYPRWLVPGMYVYVISVSESDRFFGALVEGTISVDKDALKGVDIITSASVIEWGDTLLIKIFVVDDDYYPIIQGIANITVISQGVVLLWWVLEIKDGVASLSIDTSIFFPPQRLVITVRVSSDLYRGEIESSYYLLVRKEKVSAFVNASNNPNYSWVVTYGHRSELQIIFMDNDGCEVVENLGQVIITIDGKNVIYNASLKPVIILMYPLSIDLLPGTYYIEIQLISSFYELAYDPKITLTIEMISTSIIAELPQSVEYGDPMEIYIVLLDQDNRTLAGVPISVYISNTSGTYLVGAAITNENGSARLLIRMNFKPGEYGLIIRSSATSIHVSSSFETKLNILKEDVKVELSLQGEPEVGNAISIRVRLTDNDDEPIAGVIVLISAGGRLLVRTNYNGLLEIIWIPDAHGNYTIEVKILGNGYYNDKVIAKLVHVKQASTTGGLTYGLIVLGTFGGIGVISVLLKRFATSRRHEVLDEEILSESFEELEEEFLSIFESEESEL